MAEPHEKIHPFSAEGMIAYLERWEVEHLNKADHQSANNEIARIADCVRKIGERWSRRQSQENRNKCTSCHKVLDSVRGAQMTIPIYDFDRQGWVNQYACS